MLDGVRYVDLRQNGLDWRLAGINPLWRQELLSLGASPDAGAVSALEARGLWLAPAMPAPPLAVMCAAWARSGRAWGANCTTIFRGQDGHGAHRGGGRLGMCSGS